MARQLPSSFRDPDAFVYEISGIIYRQINHSGSNAYEKLMQSGLYNALIEKKWLIPHSKITNVKPLTDDCYCVIKPDYINFISYPYEWSFGQLKDAAVLTLKIQRLALEYGMTLKDASAFNIQFHNGKAIFIDTSSFDNYKKGKGWVAYRQFCQHFLSPLMLMAKTNISLGHLLKIFIDGIPLNLTSRLLPCSSWFSPSTLLHIHFHAKAQSLFSRQQVRINKKILNPKVSINGLFGIIDSLEGMITRLNWVPAGTEWAEYYQNTNYSAPAATFKNNFIKNCLYTIKPNTVWDIGANSGRFSRLAASLGIKTISIDIDPAAVELNYRAIKKNQESNLLPLLLDISNPSPAIGWANKERLSLSERGPVDCIFALALIHHLVISNNIPLQKVVDFFSMNCNNLIIEFIPKSDTQVTHL